MRKQLLTIIFLIWPCCLFSRIYSICNVYSGPEGELDCRSFTWIGTASGNQWARCVSRDRLKNITNGGLTCIFNYCNYLCMQEYYDLSAGEIYSDCRCQTEELNKVDKNRPMLSDSCYKPSGSDCSWFDDCFSKRYPNCSETDTSLTNTNPNLKQSMLLIDFEKKFCEINDRKNEQLSDLSRQWLSKVSKCFVDKISVLIRPWRNEKCDNLEEAIFDSLKQCYLKPDSNSDNSICQLDCKSWWLVFRDIKNFYPTSNDKLNRIMNQFLKFGIKGCDDDGFFFRCWADNKLLTDFKKNFLFYRIKFQSKLPAKSDAHEIAYNTTKKLLYDLRIDSSVFDWFTNIDETNANTFMVYIVYNQGLEQLDTLTNSTKTDSSAILKTVSISFKGVESRIPFETVKQVFLTSLETCADPLCLNVTGSSATKGTIVTTQSAYTKSYLNQSTSRFLAILRVEHLILLCFVLINFFAAF